LLQFVKKNKKKLSAGSLFFYFFRILRVCDSPAIGVDLCDAVCEAILRTSPLVLHLLAQHLEEHRDFGLLRDDFAGEEQVDHLTEGT